MNIYRKRSAQRIALVSLFSAIICSPVAWLISRENAEEEIVSFAIDESRRFLLYLNVTPITEPNGGRSAQEGANALAGGIFDIAKIYDDKGNKLAEQSSLLGHRIEMLLPRHTRPAYAEAHYENVAVDLNGAQRNIIRVFVPLYDQQKKMRGYFEGGRAIPEWQQSKISPD